MMNIQLKKQFLVIVMLLISSNFQAHEKVRIYYEKFSEGFVIYADNLEYCPVSIQLNFDLTNMTSRTGASSLFVINPQKTRQLLTKLTSVKKDRPSQFAYTYNVSFGDNNLNTYDVDFEYALPFEKNSSFILLQGYNGAFTHMNENALDFNMPVGTPITAIRDGVVIKLMEEHTAVCPEKECGQYNNYIIIYHADGTFAEYTHLKEMGVIVNEGDQITQGQLIGYSGNTGWSSGPHLHLMVYFQRFKQRETLKTKFKIGDGLQSEYLIEKNKYLRNY